VTCFNFHADESVEAYPLRITQEILHDLEDNLVMFFTGYSRLSSSILKEQDEKSRKSDSRMIENLHYVKQLGLDSQEALEAGNLRKFASLMKEHWLYKKERSPNMSNPQIDEWYSLAMANGALSGKLIGAGGGGFLLFYTEDKTSLRRAMLQAGLREVRFRFDFEGTKVVAP
jgi:D-glycero-alpha-D-manno-heptose-7-phosphate kinase